MALVRILNRHLVALRLGLEQADGDLPRGDLVGLGPHLDVDQSGVALALLVDGQQCDDDLLEGRATGPEPRPAARKAKPVDRVRDLHLKVVLESELPRVEPAGCAESVFVHAGDATDHYRRRVVPAANREL
jgi:hypothetical protein